MMTSNLGLVYAPPAESPQKGHVIADVGPMPQQDVMDTHGYQMYPQKFVRLVGCHESSPVKHEGARWSH
ncbi:MAG TPA: hypothetical protein VII39_02550 [Bradyrhizobium sp.]|jgi:hypothetical protein